MKQSFENILKAIPPNRQEYAIKQLQFIANKIKYTEDVLNNFKERNTGVKQTDRTDALELCLDILRLHGYTLSNVTSFNIDFLNFMLNNTMHIDKFKNEQITFNILNDLQIAYNMYLLEFSKEPKDYMTLRDFLFNWEEVVNKRSIEKLTEITT